MDRLFPIGRRVTQLVGPVVRGLTSIPVADEAVFGSAERLYLRLSAVRDLLADVDVTSVRLVVNPEKVVIAEARRTATYLALFGYRVDAVVVNRLLPDEVTDPWFDHHRAAQAEHLVSVEEGFAPVPVLRAALAAQEPVGPKLLRALAADLYGELDPAAHLHDGVVLDVHRQAGRWVLELPLPFTDRRDVSLVRRRDELILSVGPYRRALLLPDSLRGRRVADASVREGRLRIVFADRPRA
jgi:arsenite-transporting ATPase